nr:hypothetical protein [uncultured archaeon]
MNREGATEEEQQILDEVEELAERLGLSVEVAFSLLNRVRIEKILGRQAAIDNDIIDIHREVIPDADSKVPINIEKWELILTLLIWTLIFLLGMVVGGLVL